MKKSGKTGISFAGLLAIIFIILKLTNVIAWSWIWVLSPLWITPVIVLLLILLGLSIF